MSLALNDVCNKVQDSCREEQYLFNIQQMFTEGSLSAYRRTERHGSPL